MAVKKVIKEVNVYVCDNCGAEYSSEHALSTCAITGKQICDKCGETVYLAHHDEDEFYVDEETVLQDLVNVSDYSLEFDRDEYLEKCKKLWDFYKEQAKEIDKAYLEGTIRSYKIPNE